MTPFREMDRNRRALILGAAGLAGLLIIFLAVKVFGGGSSPPLAPFSPTPSPTPGAAGAPTTTAPPAPVPTYQIFTTKDPFLPLQVPGASTTTTAPAGTTGSTPTTTPGVGTGIGSTTTTTSPSVGTSGASAAGGTAGGSTAPGPQETVQLLDVYASGSRTDASVEVDSTVYTVSAGQSFDTDYRVVDLSLATGCGDFTRAGHPFRLCKGQQVLK